MVWGNVKTLSSCLWIAKSSIFIIFYVIYKVNDSNTEISLGHKKWKWMKEIQACMIDQFLNFESWKENK